MIPGESVATQHRMLVMEMKAVRQSMSPRERNKRTRWWKLKQEQLKDAFISKTRVHLCSLEAEGKETNWNYATSKGRVGRVNTSKISGERVMVVE